MDIILHCVDPTQLKAKGLYQVFPAVCRFNQVSHCSATRRIAGGHCTLKRQLFHNKTDLIVVGSSSGTLTIYELRQNKQTTIQAHSAAITACAFSPDGKFLVSYACGENKLCFWQTSTGTLWFVVTPILFGNNVINCRYVRFGYVTNALCEVL